MKKKSLLSMLILIVGLAFIFTGCGGNNEEQKYNIYFYNDTAIYQTIETKGNELINMPENPTKTNYNFGGWFIDKDIWQQPFSYNYLLTNPITSNLNVYAKWEFIKGSDEELQGTQAKFENFTNKGNDTFYIKVLNSTATLNFSDIVKTNSTSKWQLCTDIQATQTIPSKVATLNAGDNTYYILVTDKSDNVKLYTMQIRRNELYRVEFNSLGGSTIEDQIIEEDSKATMPTTPIKTGYNFKNWDFDFNTPITQNIIITASWQAKNYNIIYHGNNGTTNTITQTATYDSIIYIKDRTTFNYNGYSFIKWNTKADGTGTTYRFFDEFRYTIDGDLDLYAIYDIVNYSISYYLDGGEVIQKNPKSYNVETETITLNTPTKTGYNFMGWFTESTFDNKIESVEKGSTGNLTLYAKWEAKTFKIQLIVDGGECDKSFVIATYYQHLDLPVPTKENYEFKYWYSVDSLDSTETSGIIFSADNDNTVWAHEDIYFLKAKWATIYLYSSNTIIGLTDYGKTLSNITIPNEIDNNLINSIGNEAFNNNPNLISLTIPETIVNFGTRAFANLNNLEYLYYNAKHAQNLNSSSNIFFDLGIENKNVKVVFGDSVEYIPDYLFYVNVKDSIWWPGVKSITIGKNVIEIGINSFERCKHLTEIIFDENSKLNTIGYSAFKDCVNLNLIKLPESVLNIDNSAFSGCESITSMVLPNTIINIGDYAFQNCKALKSINIPTSISVINSYIFENCEALTYIAIPNNITEIGNYVFNGCNSLTKIDFLGTIEDWIMIDEGYEWKSNSAQLFINGLNWDEYISPDLVIPNGITKIGEDKFSSRTDLTSVAIPDTCISINGAAFKNCSALKYVIISNVLTTIDHGAFISCSSLRKIYFIGIESEIEDISIGVNNTAFTNATKYYYIENKEDVPTDGGNYWHYDTDGVTPIEWDIGAWYGGLQSYKI